MEPSKEGKRKKDKNSDEDEKRRERKSKRARGREESRSRSPQENREKDTRRKRRHSKSRSHDVPVKHEKQSNSEKEPEIKKEAPVRRAKETDMLNTRTGGAYIPPARLRMMQAQITDKTSVAYQRLAWEALKKSIHGHINKINVGNIGIIIKELLKENIVRGRGLLCRSVIQAQAASPTFTNVYAALVAAVNSRFPNIGELLLKRLVIQFKRGFKRNDKATCISSASFIAHLVNQRVAHEILALELLTLLVETPTDDSVEVAIAFLKECGQKLTEVSSKGVNAIFEMLRNILHEGQLDKRVQYMIEVMFQVWKDGFKDHPALIEELELVPEEEQFTHLMMLDEATDPQDILNVFKFDDKYEENEQKYKTLSKEILGSDAESGDDDSSEGSGSDDEDDDEEEQEQKAVTIIDNTETNLVALRRTIYLTINSSLDFEECAHKLMKMQLKPGQEVELCHMFLDCCAEQRTYEKFYGLLAQRFCNINRIYIGPFEEIFKDSYATAHRLDTNRLRNVSKFFAHLLFTDSISWEVMECVKLNEEDTTSSSRIYIKILFQELAEYMGLKKLNDRLKDPTLQDAFSGIFPRDNPKNTRFSINFFTSIGLGGLTDELREHLKQMPKNVPPAVTEIKLDSESSSDSSSDSSSSSSSSSSDSSSSDDEEEDKSRKKKKTKKDKTKEKEPETLAEKVANDKNERWGHDGFYDTYGKGAKRIDARSGRDDRDVFVRPRDRNDRRNGNDNRDKGNDSNRNRDDSRRNKDRDDFRERQIDDRTHRDDDRRRNDDKNEREGRGRNDNRARRDEDYSRRNDDGDDRNGDRNRKDEARYRNNDDRSRDEIRSRKDDNPAKDDSRRRNVEENMHKGSDREYRENRTQRDDDRNCKADERTRRNDDRSYGDEDRERDDDRARKSNKGSGKDKERNADDRSRKEHDKVRRDDDRSREDNDRSHKGDERAYVDDRNKKGDDRRYKDYEKSRRDNERSRRSDDEEFRDENVRRGDKSIGRKDDSIIQKKAIEEKAERDRRIDRSEVSDQRYPQENAIRSKRNDNIDRTETSSDARQKEEKHRYNKNVEEEQIISKKVKKEHKKKSKKDKKEKRKVKEVDSDDDYFKRKNKHVNDVDSDDDYFKRKEKLRQNEGSDYDGSSSSESEVETAPPGRYWDSFKVKGRESSSREVKAKDSKVRDRRALS